MLHVTHVCRMEKQERRSTFLLLGGFRTRTYRVVRHVGLNLIGRGKCMDTVGDGP